MELKQGTVLLTGCAGFVGFHTGLRLLRGGVKVVGVDNMNDYYSVLLKKYRLEKLKSHAGFRFLRIDIEDRAPMEALFRENRFSAVVNLAARAGVGHSFKEPGVYFSTNAIGTLNLLELMRTHRTPKFVLASTSSLYAGQEMPFREDLPVNRPVSPYAASKKAAEVTAYTYHHVYGIDVTVLRYFTVYGPAGRPDMSIVRFIKWIGEGKPLEIFGDGSQSRDFTYIDDIAKGTAAAAAAKTGYEIINLGSGSSHDLLSIISLIEDRMGKKALIKNLPALSFDIKSTRADISRAGSILGWKPETAIGEGIDRTVSWYLENREILKNMGI